MAADQRALDTPLNEYLRTLRRRIWWLISTTLIVVVAAGLYSYSETKVYTGTAAVEVTGTAGGGKGASPIISTDSSLINSSAVQAIVSKELRGMTPLPSATALNSGNNNIISVSATDTNASDAATIADDYAKALVQVIGQQAVTNINNQISQDNKTIGTLQDAVKSLQNDLKSVLPGDALTPSQKVDQNELQSDLQTIQNLQIQIGNLSTQITKAGATALIASNARIPKAPSSPKTSRNVGLGLVVGLVFGLILVFVVDAFDDSVRTESDIDRIYPELPHLGVIPIVENWSDVSRPYVVSIAAPRSVVAEAYRSLRTAIEFTRLNQSVRSMLVTSSVGLEGKTSTVANLGVTFARAGKKTLVISADLRRPRLGSFLSLDENIGLTSIALGIASIDEAVRPVDNAPGLFFLGTGPLPDGAAEFLSSPRLEAVLHELREEFDMVIIDAPPVLPVTDAVVMSRYVDGVLLVVAQNRTSRRSLAKIRRTFTQVRVPLIGSILNGAIIRKSDNYGYYGYYAQADAPNGKDAGRSSQRGNGRGARGSEKVRTRT